MHARRETIQADGTNMFQSGNISVLREERQLQGVIVYAREFMWHVAHGSGQGIPMWQAEVLAATVG